MPEHHAADRTVNSGEGVHPIMRWIDKATAALRTALAVNAANKGGVVHQTGGDVPGFYLQDTNWHRLQMGDPPIVSPAQLLVASSPFEDYEPVNAEAWKYGTMFRLTSDASVVVGGFKTIPAVPRGIRHIVNANTIASGFNITLKHLGGGGVASSDILIAGAVDLVLPPNGAATVWEDITTGKWRVL